MSGKGIPRCAKCGITAKEDSSLRFYRFPLPSKRDGPLRTKVWATFCFPNGDWTSDVSLRKLHTQPKMLCGKHFDNSSFSSSDRKRLNKFAIPIGAQNILNQLRNEQCTSKTVEISDKINDINCESVGNAQQNMKVTRVLGYCKSAMKSLRETESAVNIKAPWGNLCALTWGDPSKPPVLLCPGRLQPGTVFRPLIFSLPDSFFYVALDLPGNGCSDPLPLGVRYTVLDLVPSLLTVADHYKWNKFMYIGHSLGAAVGKYFNIAYPERITKFVELDPIPAYFTSGVTTMHDWYHTYYGNYYNEVSYKKHNAGPETAPRYTMEKIKQLVQNAQGLTDEAMEHIIERSVEPAGDGLYRFTYDQRMKQVTLMPFPSELLKKIFTEPKTPTLAILAQEVLNAGTYDDVPFLTDEKAWPNGNFRFKIVPGNHDVHVNDPACMAGDIASFLTGAPAKL